MLRLQGYFRKPEPRSVNLDEALLYHDRAFLRQGNEQMARDLFASKPGHIPDLESTLTEDKLIVDIACGTGEFSGALAKVYPKNEVLGIDISKDALKVARREYRKVKNLGYQRGDIYELSTILPKKAGLITANLALHNFDNLEGAVQQIYQSLDEKGAFFFSDLNPEEILKKPALALLYRTRNQLGEDVFVNRFVRPVKERGNTHAQLDLALTMSFMASYTKEEIKDALSKSGFKSIKVEPDDTGEALAGYAIK